MKENLHKLLVFFMCVSFVHIGAQKLTIKIDSLLWLASKSSEKQDFNKSIIFSNEALKLSQKNTYLPGIAGSYYRIAHSLCTLEKYRESLDYIVDFENKYGYYLDRDLKLKADFKDLLGRNYSILGFKDEAVKQFNDELSISRLLDRDSLKYAGMFRSYLQLTAVYQGTKNDSVYHYLNKAKTISSKISKSELPIFYYNLAFYHIHYTKNLDSSSYYNIKALAFDIGNKSKYLSLGILQKADIEYMQKKYDESLVSSFDGLQLAKKQKRIDHVLEAYKYIARNYKELGDYQNQARYLGLYTGIKDSISKVRLDGVQSSANIIVSNNKKQIVKDGQRLTKNILISTAVLIFIVILLAIIKIKYNQKNKLKLLIEKEHEIKILNNKFIDQSYEEIVIMAKNNDSAFLTRFKDAYPGFCDNILKIYPDIINSELIFCAYLKLNFSTKEIATYTFVTPKAVQNRKNRIRKKLNIPSDEDIYIWMSRIGG